MHGACIPSWTRRLVAAGWMHIERSDVESIVETGVDFRAMVWMVCSCVPRPASCVLHPCTPATAAATILHAWRAVAAFYTLIIATAFIALAGQRTYFGVNAYCASAASWHE